jgi:hypothetical protein
MTRLKYVGQVFPAHIRTAWNACDAVSAAMVLCDPVAHLQTSVLLQVWGFCNYLSVMPKNAQAEIS